MRNLFALIIILCLYVSPAKATTYFVKSSGNDGADGLTPTSAWKSLDNGDIEGVLVPGDTVHIFPGVYYADRSYVLTTSGQYLNPIVYSTMGDGQAAVRSLSGFNATVEIQSNHIVLQGLQVSCDILVDLSGIQIDGDSCVVTECVAHDLQQDGIKVNGSDNTILKNAIYSCPDHGIESTAFAGGNRYYGNTIYNNGLNGVDILGVGNQNRVFNNIVVDNGQFGISGSADNVCGFNDVWSNLSGDYANGVADSSGGISDDPLFVDTTIENFNLREGSPAIDAGLDLGYPYHGDAPDMGAHESLGTSPTGTAIWRSGSGSIPKYAEWDGTAFGIPGNSADVGIWRIMAGAEAPTRDEIILLGVDGNRDITGQIWDGASWNPLPFNPLASVTESFWWGFDIAYEQRSGDAVIVWNNGTSGTKGISFRVWNGSSWTAEDSITTPLSGEPKHMRIAANPNSNEMVLMVSNAMSHDYAVVWDGSAWGNSQVLDPLGSGDDRTDIYAAYGQQGGQALVTYGKGISSVFYQTWDGADWGGESTLAKPADADGTVRWTTLASDPNSGRIALGVLTANQDVWLCIWDGDSWETPQTATNSATGTIYPGVAVAFESLTSEAIATYAEADGVKYRTWIDGGGWSPEETAANLGSPANSMMLDAATDTDHIMLSVQDDDSDLSYIMWYGGSWGPTNELEIETDEVKNQPFIFLWHQSQPPADLQISKNVDNGTPSVNDTVQYTVTIANNGPDNGTGIEVTDLLPGQVTYDSAVPSQGAYNNVTGLWAVGDLGNGATADLVLKALVNPGTEGTTIRNFAEVTGLSEIDPVSANDIDSVDVIVNRPPELASIGPKSVEEGQNLNFTVSASDPDGTTPALTAEDVPTNGSFLDNGDGTGTLDFNPDYSQSGIYDVTFIASDGALADSEVVEMIVDPAPVSCIVVAPDSVVVSADSTVQFAVTGYDAGGEEEDPADITWGLTADLGTIDPDGLFDPTVVGTGRVTALSSLGPVDTTSYLEVIPGSLGTLSISPDRAAVSSDSTLQFSASGQDEDGNAVTEMGELTWEVLREIGTIDQSGLFTPVRAGTGFIKVISNLGPFAKTDTITVVPGEVSCIDVLPASQIVIEDSSYQFRAYAYDSDSNFVYDAAEDADWSTTDPSGSVTGLGLYTAGTNPSPPLYYVTAQLHVPLGSLHLIRDSSRVTVITSGSLKSIRVERFDGVEFGDTTLTTDIDTTRLYCRGYDSADGLIGDLAANWTLISDDSIGTLASGPANLATLGLSRIGTGRVSALYGGGLADTTGLITCTSGVPARLAIVPDTVTLTAGDSVQFTTQSCDADGNPSAPVTIDSWRVIGGIGTIAETGLMKAISVGTGRVTCSGEGLADTTGPITVLPGVLSRIQIAPDSAEVLLGSITRFDATGFDGHDNPTEIGTLTWSVVGEIGTIDESGVFTALEVGSGRIAATSNIGGISDTNCVVIVHPSNLAMIVVAPDTATVSINSDVQFNAYAFDANFDPVDAGPLTWEVLGGIGTIDASGMFTAAAAGIGRVGATSNIGGIGDTTNMIVVEVPTISGIPIGNTNVHAGQVGAPILAFRISNAFESKETIVSVTVRDCSIGSGSAGQVRSNIDSIAVYIDSDESDWLSPADVLIAKTGNLSSSVTLSFPPVMIGPGSDRAFFVTANVSPFPRDGDALDMYLLPASDIETGSGSVVAGPDSLNSFGYCIVDGLTAAQVDLVPTGNGTISAQGGIANVLTVDLPRNGYSDDVLEILSVFNAGTADTMDIDSLILYMDNDNGVWDADHEEVSLGNLSFTGRQWELSGLSVALNDQTHRFFVGAKLAQNAMNGGTIALGIPLHGLEMTSNNDGPIDEAVTPIETITIATPELVSLRVIGIPGHELIPGVGTGSMLGIEFANGYAVPVVLDSIICTLEANDPDGATQSQLDSQFGTVRMWLNRDQDYATHSPVDSLIATANLGGGAAVFRLGSLILLPGRVEGVFVETSLDAVTSKNGNSINFSITDDTDIHFAGSVLVSGDFPLTNPEDFIINTFPAPSVTIHPVAGATLFGWQTDRLALDFELPKNGYADDVLKSIRIINTGSTAGRGAMSAAKLWADPDGNGLTGDETPLGEFGYEEESWLISGLSLPLTDSRSRFLVTIDVGTGGFDAGTVRLEIPVQGVEYHSGTDGPDDAPVGNPDSHFLFPAKRITVIPIPQDPATVEPGAVSVQILTFALYNGYIDQTHVLESIRLSNRTRSVSTHEFTDYEIGQVSLYQDHDGDRQFQGDSLLATGYFSAGDLSLSGLDVSLLAESLSYFFVVTDLPLDIVDSDTLGVIIEKNSDLTFGETVSINGDFPVSRGGDLVVDGSVSRQYETTDVEFHTLSPGDVSIPVFAFRPAVNGDQADTLMTLKVANGADADRNDIESVILYLDENGDGSWQPIDRLLAQAEYAGGLWEFHALNLEVTGRPAMLFVAVDVAEGATPDRALQAVIPIDGCEYTSENDGPTDNAIRSKQTFIISRSGFKVTYDTPRSTYSVGQEVPVDVRVTNLLPIGLSEVSCVINVSGQLSILMLDSSFVGPSDLESGETGVFFANYTALEAGEVFWEIQAFSSSVQESSSVIRTEPVVIQSAPAGVSIDLISSIPTSVTRGQSRVFPLSIKYRHADGSPLAAPMRLDSLRLRVADGNGDPKGADQVFSRMVLATGYTNLVILDPLPSAADVALDFNQPAILPPGTEQVLSLRVDIDSAATVNSFTLGLESEEAIRFMDINTGTRVPVDPAAHFPLRTAACRINNPSQNLAVSYLPMLNEFANYGQRGMDVMSIILRHPGKQDDSQIQFTGLSLQFFDDQQRRISVSEIFDDVKLLKQQTVIADLNDIVIGDTLFTFWLSAPPVLSAGEVDTVKLNVSLKAETLHPSFGALVKDSTLFVLRDLSSGALVEAVGDTRSPVIGPVFPMSSGFAQLKYPADDPEVCVSSALPQSVIAGSDSIALVVVDVRNSAGGDKSCVWLGSVRVSVVDSLGVPLDPHFLFDRIGLKLAGGLVTYESSIGTQAGYTVFHVGLEGMTIDSEEALSLALIADIEADTPYDHFVLRMYAENGLQLLDATDRGRKLGLVEAPICTGAFPYSTGVTKVHLPAGAPRVKAQKLPAQIGFPGQTGLTALLGELNYSSTGPRADLVLKRWRGRTLRRTSDGLLAVPAGAVFGAVRLLLDEEVIAVDTVLAGDAISLEPEGEYILSRGQVRTVRLTCDIRPDTRLGNYVIQFADSSFVEFMDGNLLTTIYPVLVGNEYPLFTSDLSVMGADLGNSFTNWPNPFNPGHEVTTIGFVLPGQADVDIEIFTVMGDLVKRVVTGAKRPAGSNDLDSWNGSNERGHTVIPGTYICRIRARYASGRVEEARRIVAVVR